MVHLLGINHSFQVRAVLPFSDGGLDNAGSAHIADALETYIIELVDQLRIHTVAEEYSAERLLGQLEVDHKAHLVAKKACSSRKGLQHIFCDPDRTERAVMYATAQVSEAEDEQLGFPLREEEWIRRLRPHVPLGEILFLCGAKHVSSLSHRLNIAGISFVVVCKDFEAKFLSSAS